MSFIILILLISLLYFGFKNRFLLVNLNAKNVNMQNAIVLDVRTQEEWDAGHSENAINIPLHMLPLKIDELQKYKDKKIVVVCRSGGRAGQAIQTLQEKGFQNLQNGGAWENFK